ncbi:c-type cytochrome [Roseobacter litoralis]|uniref:c-type cytochrome n=1 Tax=Roseobacter litoralis TaxID=42443 RepID=UPI002490A92F|nr:cytochrome c [Roseobacter litoralis]
MKLVVSIGIATALAAAAAFFFFDAGPQTSVTGGDYLPNLARGEAIYAEACASCHGANLEGQPNWKLPGPDGRLPAPPHDETGHTWHHPDRLLLQITALGTAAVVGNGYESNMPGFGEIYSEEELRDVLAWIKTQWPERERDHQARVTAQDRQSN